MKQCLFILTFSALFFSSYARIIHVGKPGEVNTISQALQQCTEGDTIMVHGGRYAEKALVVRKRIVLLGIDYPILDGENRFEVLAIRANGVVVHGFKIMHSGKSGMEDLAGIKIYNCRDV